ncbi:hypothetical protein ACO0K2_07600 [Undibacterium sp. MH2W]|uniref:hypothetical protein n=1 Tax=Undibacterium sp. MH2W TaxID=3413044 RepID=UPI003BF0C46F
MSTFSIDTLSNLSQWKSADAHWIPACAGMTTWWVVVGGWWLVVGGWWLVVDG